MTNIASRPVIVLAAILSVAALTMLSCSARWEYRVLEVPATGALSRTGYGAMSPTGINVTEAVLDSLGRDGWELAGVILEMETAWPNFGSDAYVTGLQPNVRPQKSILLFKRRM